MRPGTWENMADFKTIYKENKVAVIGIPLILLVVLVNQFILKPAQEARRRARFGTAQATTPATQAPAAGTAAAGVPAAGVPSGTTPSVQPLTVPPILIPGLSEQLERRRHPPETYPFAPGRNVFLPYFVPRQAAPLAAPDDTGPAEAVPVSRPDVTYHGFVTTAAARVAIVKVAGVMHLLARGQTLPDTTFQAIEISAEALSIRDRGDWDVTFDIPLSSGGGSTDAGQGAGAAPQLSARPTGS